MNGAPRSGTLAQPAGPTVAALRAALDEALALDARAWLDEAVTRVQAEPGTIAVHFPAVGRRCGREALAGDLDGWSVDDAARAVLLAALPGAAAARAGEIEALYRFGDAAERRGVLRALPFLDLGPRALPLVEDALRTSDTRLIQAALGPYGAEHLDQALWRQAVLKCVFNEIPLATTAGLDERADADLARMLADFGRERIAAGRAVPADVWPVIDRFEGTLERSGILAELESDVPARRAAAERALADRRS